MQRIPSILFLLFLSALLRGQDVKLHSSGVDTAADTNRLDLMLCAYSWCSGLPVTGIQWVLSHSQGTLPLNDLGVYDADGCLLIDSTIQGLPVEPDYGVYPQKNNDPLNGLDALDMIPVNKHILGLEPLSGYALIAADVNKSNSITTFDIIESRRVLTGIHQNFSNNTSWRFVTADYVFPNPANPFQHVFPASDTVANQQDTLSSSMEFVAIKVGDLNCSALPGIQNNNPEDRGAAYLSMPDRQLQAGETIELPVSATADGSLIGLQLGLRFDPERLAVESVTPGLLPNWDEYITAQPRPGLLNLLWFDVRPVPVSAGAPLFVLRLKALAPLRLSEALDLATDGLHPRAFPTEQETRTLKLQFTPEAAVIGQPWPNPTNEGVTFPVTLPDRATVQARVFDLHGRLVWEYRAERESGMHLVEVPGAVLGNSGVYLWEVFAGDSAEKGKLVVNR